MVLVLLLDFSTFLAFKRGGGQQIIENQDKVLHAVAFAALFVWGYLTLNYDFFRSCKKLSLKICTLNFMGWISYGLLIEFGQKLTTYRQASLGDMIANIVGMIIGLIIVMILKPYPPKGN